VNEFIDHLYTRLGTSSTYSTTTNIHNLQITRAHAKPFPACCVFTSRFLGTVSISEKSQLDALGFRLHSLLCRTQLATEIIAPTILVTISRHGPHRKHRSIVMFISFASGMCLPSCLAGVAYPRLLKICCSGNGRCFATVTQKKGLYARLLPQPTGVPQFLFLRSLCL
jgi:hypothetical protein